MSVNFFQTECQEPPIIAPSFGICDEKEDNKSEINKNKKAYTNIQDINTWIATVENPEMVSITFTAIDNCIEILRGDGSLERRCDCMLTYPDNIVFVELKEVEKSWISDAVEQLETTIQHFTLNHDIHVYRHKRAFACNKKHPKFHVIEPSTKRRFFDTYRVRLNIQGVIKI